MIDRSYFTAGHGNPPFPVPLAEHCTVPTEKMAHLLMALLGTEGDVLEIGTGSGYQTAVLAEKCKSVVTVENYPVRDYNFLTHRGNVVICMADGWIFDSGRQFDAVLVTFGAERISHQWFKQVKEGGRLVVPMQLGQSCRICVYEKHKNELQLVDVAAYAPFTAQREN